MIGSTRGPRSSSWCIATAWIITARHYFLLRPKLFLYFLQNDAPIWGQIVDMVIEPRLNRGRGSTADHGMIGRVALGQTLLHQPPQFLIRISDPGLTQMTRLGPTRFDPTVDPWKSLYTIIIGGSWQSPSQPFINSSLWRVLKHLMWHKISMSWPEALTIFHTNKQLLNQYK